MVQSSDRSGEQRHFERHSRALFDNMAEGLVLCEAIRDGDGRLVDYWIRDANPVFLQRSVEGLAAVDRNLLSMRPATPSEWFDRCAAALQGRHVRFEFEDPISGRWYDAHMMGLSDQVFGQFFMDITHRKATERRQAELFDELNHRVKNNLTIVTSILELDARDASEEVRTHLQRAIGRVRTISELHTALHQQHSTDRIDLCAYLETLCAGLRGALLRDQRVRLEVRCEPISMALRDAVSLGLIVNELVTNAIKHAFVGRAGGEVAVAVSAVEGGMRLRVSDDGVGSVGKVPTDRLGLRMVRSLAVGLSAQITVLGGSGTGFEITIPGA